MIWNLQQTTRALLVIACLSPAWIFADEGVNTVKFQGSSSKVWTVKFNPQKTSHKFEEKGLPPVLPVLALEADKSKLGSRNDKPITLTGDAIELTHKWDVTKDKNTKFKIVRFDVTEKASGDTATFTLVGWKDGKAKLFLESGVFTKNDVKDVIDWNSPEDGSFTIK